MGKIGKISTIKREYGNQLQTLQSGLAQKGMTRIPGTGVFKYPYKELDGKYRTGLDPDAGYIKRIQDPTEKELEIERVTKLRDKLQAALGDVDLGPRSKFWNYGLSRGANDELHVKAVKLLDGDNLFDLENVIRILKKAPGCKVVDDRSDGGYITPLEAEGDFSTYISRIRKDNSNVKAINMWVVSDNLLKGAALNTVQIAECLVKKLQL